MAGLIKMAQVAGAPVRALATGPKPATAVSPERSRIASLEAQLDALRKLMDERDAAIAGHAKQIEDAFLAGEAAGREAGLAQAEARHDEALASLEQGVGEAVARFGTDLEALERLAGLLAMEGLAKVLGGEQGYADLVRATLAYHLAQLGGAGVVRAEVSSADFPEPADLAALAVGAGAPRLEIHADPDLAAGDCRIKLRLGAVEIGIGQQWTSLQALLSDTVRVVGP
jgi:flagellar assembly protein FliH